MTMQEELALYKKLRERLADILNRHVRVQDAGVSDRDFVEAVVKRWRDAVEAHHGDPNE